MSTHDPIWNHVIKSYEDRKITKHPTQWTTSRRSEDFLINFLIHDCKIPHSAIIVTTSEQERSNGWCKITVKDVVFQANVSLHQIYVTHGKNKQEIKEPADLGAFVHTL